MDRIPADAMVVVADGESARVFRNVGADGVLSLQQQELLTAKQLGDDSASGAAPTEQSPHEADEAGSRASVEAEAVEASPSSWRTASTTAR